MTFVFVVRKHLKCILSAEPLFQMMLLILYGTYIARLYGPHELCQ